MAVFKLSSDKHFIRTFKGNPAIFIYEYLNDPNTFDMIRASDNPWKQLGRVALNSAPFNELEVHGVTIRSDQLTQLINDLSLTDAGGQTFHFIVNRQGLCFVYVNSPSSSIMRLRISDYFGWSKYGVNVGQASVVWDRWDMNNGAVLVSASNEALWKKLVEEKDKALEGKDRELAALKLAMKALVNDM